MEIVSKIALITINETLVVQLISFLVFLFFINRIMFRPVSRIMDERERYVRDLEAGIEKSGSELKEIAGQIEAQESATRSEALDASLGVEATGTQEADEIYGLAREKVVSQVDAAKMAIDGQIANAVKDIRAESVSLADRIIEKLLDREPS